MSKTVAIMMVFVAIVAAVATGVIVYWLKPSTVSPVIVNIEQIHDLAELTTCEYYVSASCDTAIYGKWPLENQVGDFVMFCARGRVKGSVSLNEDKTEIDIKHDPREISIHFKPGSILVYDLNVEWQDSSAWYAISCREKVPCFSTLPRAELGTYRAMQQKVTKAMHEQAIANGIIERTQEQAKAILSGFCDELGYSVTVTFDEKAYQPGLTANLSETKWGPDPDLY